MLICLLAIGCAGVNKNEKLQRGAMEGARGDKTISIDYASAFSIDYREGYKIVTVGTPWQGSNDSIRYVLRHQQTPKNEEIAAMGQEIIIPVDKIVCNSTSQIVLLEALGAIDKLKGFPQTQYIYSPDIVDRVKGGHIKEVGVEAKMNIESILEIDPDMVMAFNTGREDRQINKLKELGVPVVINADYMEKSMLGRAEWLKFMSVFLDKEEEATAYFEQVEAQYDSLVNLVSGIDKVDVFSGSLYGGSWYMPGGRNYGALILSSAGGHYLWSDNDNTGWLNVAFEVVYEKARSADIWIGVGSFESLDALRDADSRYAEFKAFRDKRVYSYVNRVNDLGANDYFESGIIRPDLILADHIKMLHPELMPGYELYYYKQLE